MYVNDIRIRAGDKASSLRELSTELQRHNVGGITFHLPLDGPAVRALIAALGGAPAAERAPQRARPRAARGGPLGAGAAGALPLPHGGREATSSAPTRAASSPGPSPRPTRRSRTWPPGACRTRCRCGGSSPSCWSAASRTRSCGRIRPTCPCTLCTSSAWRSSRCSRAGPSACRRASCRTSASPPSTTTAATPRGARAAGGVGVAFERHAAAGARLLLRQRGFHEAKVRRVLAILQHHRDANDRLRPGLFGRILRVAEDYDTLARRSGKLSPTLALAAMLKWAGTRYDAVVLQLLINALGAYPPGTLLKLEDGRVVRSAAPARSPETFATPLARCLRLADGSPAPDDLPLVDLRGAGTGPPAARPALTDRRALVKTTALGSAWPSAGRSRRIAPSSLEGETHEALSSSSRSARRSSRPRSAPPRASRPPGTKSSP